MERVLSVFCDESGDFGPEQVHCPYYLLSFVFHDQQCSISDAVMHLDEALHREGLLGFGAIHCGPLIGREWPYANLDFASRRRIFSHLEYFARHCEISIKVFVVKRREYPSGASLASKLTREVGLFLQESLEFLQGFDKIVLYYDEGQREISKILKAIFSAKVGGVEFRTVCPADYRLFQVADLTCTLALLRQKQSDKGLSASELAFFGTERELRRNHLKLLSKMEFHG